MSCKQTKEYKTEAAFTKLQISGGFRHGMERKTQRCLNSIEIYTHISFQEAFLMRCFANSFQSPLLHCTRPHFSPLLFSLPLSWGGTRAVRRESSAPAPLTFLSPCSHFQKVFPEHGKNNSVTPKLF